MLKNKQNMQSLDQQREDSGFGTTYNKNASRMINANGSFNVKRMGASWQSVNLYQYLLSISWLRFWAVILSFYLLFNLLFAFLYILVGANINGIEPDANLWHRFAHAFFFSTQTFTTVGYGYLNPSGVVTNLIAALEAMSGLLAFAIATGLVYGRFSRPSARIIFSRNALISPHKNGQSLQFRMANERSNKLIEVEVQLLMAYIEKQNEGVIKRRFLNLPLDINKVYFFPLNWSLVHTIEADSPLYNLSEQDYRERDIELLILIKAFDDTFSQTIYIHHSYKWNEIVHNAKFSPMFYTDEQEGITVLELDKINNYAALTKH